MKRLIRKAVFAVIAFSMISGAIGNVSSEENSSYEKTLSQMDTLLAMAGASYSVDEVPKWNGKPYVIIDGNQTTFKDKLVSKAKRNSFTKYKSLDSLGRTRTAYGSLSSETVNNGERMEIGMIKPSGWVTKKYPNLIDGNYLYNRSHLLMQKAAAGINAAACNSNKNLVTGTRYMNVDGMLPFENEILSYIQAYPENHVIYKATPIYNGNELVCRGVQLQAYSVEDYGKLNFNVYVYNIQPGIEIDYATGESEEKDYLTQKREVKKALKNGSVTVNEDFQ